MDYEEIQALESYKKQAQAILADRRREQAEAEKAATEHQERERVEQWEVFKANLAEIVPPALHPLMQIDDSEDSPRGYQFIPFIYDDHEILHLKVRVNANMTVNFIALHVPDARLCDYDAEGWAAHLTFDRYSGPIVEQQEGGSFEVSGWEMVTALAFEHLDAYREYEQRAAQHNAELEAARAVETEETEIVPAEDAVAAEATPTFTVIEDENIFCFERTVNAHLNDGWVLHGPMQVVAVPPDTRYEDLERFTLYVQALIRPEVA